MTTTATGLRMVRGEVDLREFNRWMGSRRLQDPDHAMHCLLMECFGEKAPKPFRLVATRGASVGSLYGYGTADAGALRESAAICACPLQARVLPADRIDDKPMPAEWRVGLRLGFEARVRPVVRYTHRGECGNADAPCRERRFARKNQDERRLARKDQCANCRASPERDAFLHEALTHDDKGEMERTGRTREAVYRDWLASKLAGCGGAILDTEKTRLASFRRTRAVRKLHRRHSEGPDALMRGELEVTDSAAFGALLARGIGRHRAYGYGMLLLSPASGRG